MKITQEEYDQFRELIEKIVNTDKFKQMKEIKQHRFSDCYNHSINVATRCFIYAKKMNLKVDLVSLIRGALLHDFYLYDWKAKKESGIKHGYTHPSIALKNARAEYEDLNKIEEDIILSHMWPLTFFRFPKYKESYLVCFSDKICAIEEMRGKKKKML